MDKSILEIRNFNSILRSFGVKMTCVNYFESINAFYYDLKLGENSKIHNISKIADELSLILKAMKPTVSLLRQQGFVRIEFLKFSGRVFPQLYDIIPNVSRIDGLSCMLGVNTSGEKLWMDFADSPHTIISGTTGSGKTVLLHNIIANLQYFHSDAKLFLMDPKYIEFSEYKLVKNVKVVHSYDQCVNVFDLLVHLMEDRYMKMKKDPSFADKMSYVVCIIDEFSNLMSQDKDNKLYELVLSLSQKSRAAKIHLILSTQRPSAKIIDGNIKANFPARISCRVTNQYDSKIVLDQKGAEDLLGKGDALIKSDKHDMVRFQVANVSKQEILKMKDF